jgi:PAS domain S-box-containing protein
VSLGSILVWNKSAERVYGYTAAETVGKNLSILIPKDKAPDLPLIFDAVKSGNVVDNYETVRKKKDGKLINVSIVASPIRDESGNVVSISWTSRDITEHKRIEDSLRDSEEQFRAIFQMAAIGISQMSLDGDSSGK